jgi:hypothetical protein
MTAFKNDKPQFQSFTGSYQAFGEPPAKSIKWLLLGQNKKTLNLIYGICAYINCNASSPSLKIGITRRRLSNHVHVTGCVLQEICQT